MSAMLNKFTQDRKRRYVNFEAFVSQRQTHADTREAFNSSEKSWGCLQGLISNSYFLLGKKKSHKCQVDETFESTAWRIHLITIRLKRVFNLKPADRDQNPFMHLKAAERFFSCCTIEKKQSMQNALTLTINLCTQSPYIINFHTFKYIFDSKSKIAFNLV